MGGSALDAGVGDLTPSLSYDTRNNICTPISGTLVQRCVGEHTAPKMLSSGVAGMKKLTPQGLNQGVIDQAIVERLTTLLQGHEDVRAAYLFGSRARGSQGPTSDVDLAITFAPPASAWAEVELQELLTAQLGMPVQVIDLARAGPHIVAAVSQEGVQLIGEAQVLAAEGTAMEEAGPHEEQVDAQAAEAMWLLESVADKVQRLDRALPLLADVVPEAVLAGEMVAVRDFIGVFMLLIEPLETLVRRVSRYAHLVLGYTAPDATLRAQTALAAQVMGVSAIAVEGLGAMARLRGQLAHAYWELDEEAIQPLTPQRLQPLLEHFVERASRFVLVEQARWQRR
jgi:predicted nucleotidyltransferase